MNRPRHFNATARWLHWGMAAMVLAMLFVGVVMVSSMTLRPALLSLHRPLGVAILLLAVGRLANRLRHPPPPLPADLPWIQAMAAHASHWLLYAMLFAMPLVGWAMVSAAGNPVLLWPGLTLPAIAPHDPAVYSLLRGAHAWLARLLFGLVLLHLAAALFHAWVRKDGVFESMARSGAPGLPQDANDWPEQDAGQGASDSP